MDESKRSRAAKVGRKPLAADQRAAKLEEEQGLISNPAMPPADIADVATNTESDAVSVGGATAARPAEDRVPLLDPGDPETLTLLRKRTPSGGYAVPEAMLVRIIRAWGAVEGKQPVIQKLCELLIERCMPEFQRRSWGLRHRPQLMEDAIMGMIEQVLREAQDPAETFMTLNFIHYLRCCCADNFGRVLRQEGLTYRRDEQGRPVGRPQHVPQSLLDRIDVVAEDQDDAVSQPGVVADPHDKVDERMAAVEAERILGYLADPMDRQIMVLRALEHMRWDDIAKACGKTERTMRLRYEKALVKLRQCIEAETAAVAL